jgi:hypothetical protein
MADAWPFDGRPTIDFSKFDGPCKNCGLRWEKHRVGDNCCPPFKGICGDPKNTVYQNEFPKECD